MANNVSANNLTSLYGGGGNTVSLATVAVPTVDSSIASRNLTTLYSSAGAPVIPTSPYGNGNVERFLNAGTDGGNSVVNIVMSGDITVGGESNLGLVGNVHITGGQLNYILTTDGGGGLSWEAPGTTIPSIIPFIHFDVIANGNNQQFTDANLSFYSSNVQYVNLMKNGVNIDPTNFQFISPTTIQVDTLLATGDSVDVLATGSGGGGGTPGGNVYEVQYNGGLNDFVGNSSFTFFQANSTLTVGNLVIPGTSDLGDVANVIITGGTADYVLKTDGTGNLSWTAQTAGGNGNITVQDEGSNIVSANIMNFVGNGVTASNIANVATITIPGGITGILVKDEGSNILTSNTMNFVGAGVTVSNVANIATITIPGGGGGNTTWANVTDKNGANGPSFISIGTDSNANTSGGISLGVNSGSSNQQDYAIAIGFQSGTTTQGANAIAVGTLSGQNYQGEKAVAIGSFAGQDNQGNMAIAIGFGAGQLGGQEANSIAIGANAGMFSQGAESIAIGHFAGFNGYVAGQANNSIILNATGANLNQTVANTFTVKPVRSNSTANLMFYDSTSGEISYDLSSSTTVGNANYAAYAGNVTIAAQPNITSTGTLTNLTVADNFVAQGNVTVQRAYEVFTANATGSTGTVNFDVLTQSILNKTANATANCTLNIRGNSTVTLNTMLPINNSVTIAYLNPVGGTAYVISAVTIDGVAVTPKYVNGSAPTIGTRLTSATQSYTYSILKTAANTYTVLGSLTEYQ